MAQDIALLYGTSGLTLRVPDKATILEGQSPAALPSPAEAVAAALADPIGSPPLHELIEQTKPRTVAITISDITRPVPNRDFLPGILQVLNAAGIADEQVVIIVGTGMHRPSTADELERLVGPDLRPRLEIVDHRADASETLVKVTDSPPVFACRRFVEADFRIVTGYIEPHFMAGFSGGRKGVCPALVDLRTVQRFHGYDTLADPAADNGRLDGNPCHAAALEVAKAVGVDFLFNVAITRDRRMAGIYCGDLEKAHVAGCRQVAEWTSATIERPFDLVVTNGGGDPLDQTFYQTVKGMCTALPALGPDSTLLQVSHCGEKLGSGAYTDLMLRYDNNWQQFLADIEANRPETALDQWEFQMQCRVLSRIGRERLLFVSDGIDMATQQRICVTPVTGDGDAQSRAQAALDGFAAANPDATIAVIPEGPYTLLR